MATFLSLTNELLRRLNEVEMDSNNFSGARNIQALAKDAINASVREILHVAQEWPFTLATGTTTTVAGTAEYSFPADLSSVDWDSFYVRQHGDQTNIPQKLEPLPYVEFLRHYRSRDETGGTAAREAPRRVYMTQESKFGLTPPPDKDYVIEYKYWTFPTEMSLYSDTCIVPDRFKGVIIDGGMMFLMIFRSNEQSAAIHREKFDNGIRTMRRILIDDPVSMTSTMILKPAVSARVLNG
jgi:hypothetical protein